MLVILTIGYRAKCVADGCGNLAKAIARYTDSGGRPIRQEERCAAHTGTEIAAAGLAGIKVHDDRKG
jgi:hypothetical protein